MTDAFIYDHIRSPRGRGRSDGALHDVTPVELLAQVLRALATRSDLPTARIDDVVIGCVSAVGEQGGNIARAAVLCAGYDESVPGKHLNRFCASGLEAINVAAAHVIAGHADLIVAGGVESMSRVPMGSDGGAWFTDPAVAWRTYFVPQGIGADLIATRENFSRADLDAYAVQSQRRAAHAWQDGRFGRSITPIRNLLGEIQLDRDEALRPGTTLEDLQKLNPAFVRPGEEGGFDGVALQRYPDVERVQHRHTAGNSSGIVDGAAAVLIGSKAVGRRLGLKPRARIVTGCSIGSEPTIMLTGPALVARRALARARMAVTDIDLFELNEAFAAVVLLYMRELDLEPSQVNVNGGAIALGHPLGATGAMILGTAVDELERSGMATALVNLCVGAGMGTASIIERV